MHLVAESLLISQAKIYNKVCYNLAKLWTKTQPSPFSVSQYRDHYWMWHYNKLLLTFRDPAGPLLTVAESVALRLHELSDHSVQSSMRTIS